MTPRNEFDGTEREALIEKVAVFVEQMGDESDAVPITPPGNDEIREFRTDLLAVLKERQERNPMVTRAAVITNLEKSLEG